MRTARLALALPFILPIALVGQGRDGSSWTSLTSREDRFTIQGPGPARSDPAKPGHYAFALGDSSFLIEAAPLDAVIERAMSSSDRSLITKYLEAMRDGSINSMKATRRRSSTGKVEGHPSIRFSLDGMLENKPFEAHQLIVLTDERMYTLIAIGAKGQLKKADADRFLKSFHVVNAAPAAAVAFRTVTFADAACARIPPVPITFEMPEDFLVRAFGRSTEAGCLWGTRQDLDRVTADPSQGDFRMLRRGVFHTRISTNVVFGAQTGAFGPLDGTGELGLRRQLETLGGRVVVWKKQTLADLPALEIVADAGETRVFMLYLGGTPDVPNVLVVNYYPATKRSADDDRLWARFVAGIKKTT